MCNLTIIFDKSDSDRNIYLLVCVCSFNLPQIWKTFTFKVVFVIAIWKF